MYRDFIVITNRKLCQGSLVEQMKKLVKLKPGAIILRDKDLSDEEYSNLARKIYELCLEKDSSVDFYVHSRVDIAMELGVKNIHLTIPAILDLENKPEEKKRLLDYFGEVSVSCHSVDDLKIAEKFGATRIVLGTIFETECKPGKEGAGLEFVRDIASLTKLPVYAIGGIKYEHLNALKEAGAAGGCMMSTFMKL